MNVVHGEHGLPLLYVTYNCFMNKKLLIIGLVLGIIVLLIAIFQMKSKSTATTEIQDQANFAAYNNKFIEPQTTMKGELSIETVTGSKISVPDIRIKPETVTFDGQDFKFYDSGDGSAAYELLYFSGDSSFLISLESEPLRDARNAGEIKLLNELAISSAEACQLKIRVATNIRISEAYAGKELGLSFCPGSVAL